MWMKIFEDDIVNGAAKLLCATIPLFTLGFMGNTTLLYVSGAIGVVALIVMAARIPSILGKNSSEKDTGKKGELFAKAVGELLGLPYALALSSLIAMAHGIDASIGIWIGGFIAMGQIASLIPGKNKK